MMGTEHRQGTGHWAQSTQRGAGYYQAVRAVREGKNAAKARNEASLQQTGSEWVNG